MIDLSAVPELELVAMGQAKIVEERVALLRTPTGRKAAIRELMALKAASRQRRISPKELIASVALLTYTGDPKEDLLTADALQLFNTGHWNRVRADVDKCSDEQRGIWVQSATDLGEIVGAFVARHRGIMNREAVKMHYATGIPVSDYFAEMVLAIPFGIERFRPEEGVKFLTALMWSFKASLFGLVNRDSMIRYPRGTNTVRAKLHDLLMQHAEAGLEMPSVPELAEILSVPETTVMAAMSSTLSLDGPTPASEDKSNPPQTWADILEAPPTEDPVEAIDATYTLGRLTERLDSLTSDQIGCLQLRIPFNEQTGITSLPLRIEEARVRLMARAARKLVKYQEKLSRHR